MQKGILTSSVNFAQLNQTQSDEHVQHVQEEPHLLTACTQCIPKTYYRVACILYRIAISPLLSVYPTVTFVICCSSRQLFLCPQSTDSVGWASGRASGLQKLTDEVLVWLSGVRCRLFAHGPADATASQNPAISCLI